MTIGPAELLLLAAIPVAGIAAAVFLVISLSRRRR
jgi:hypothetical protein